MTRKIFKSKQNSSCISRKKKPIKKSLARIFPDYHLLSPSCHTPTSQLTIYRNKKEKREEKENKKKERRNWSPGQKSHPAFRSAIDYRFTGRWASRHSSKSRWIDRATIYERSVRREKSSILIAMVCIRRTQGTGEVTGVVPSTIPPDYDTHTRRVAPTRSKHTLEIFSVVCYSPCSLGLSGRSIDRIDRFRGGRPTNDAKLVSTTRWTRWIVCKKKSWRITEPRYRAKW